jgi:hypothetical protein
MRSTYLIAGALVLALVAAGVLFGTDFFRKNPFATAPSRESQIMTRITDARIDGVGIAATFAERDAKRWRLAGGHRLERFAMDDGNAVFARLTSGTALDKSSSDWERQGLSLSLPTEFNNRTTDKTIEIGFAARSPQVNGSDVVSVVYATRQAGNSGWQAFPIGRDFQLFKFTYKVPHVEGGYTNEPIITFTSDAQGTGRSVELMGVYVKPIPSQP